MDLFETFRTEPAAKTHDPTTKLVLLLMVTGRETNEQRSSGSGEQEQNTKLKRGAVSVSNPPVDRCVVTAPPRVPRPRNAPHAFLALPAWLAFGRRTWEPGKCSVKHVVPKIWKTNEVYAEYCCRAHTAHASSLHRLYPHDATTIYRRVAGGNPRDAVVYETHPASDGD